jgi:HTH-type transcriptional regulator/antitoxin HigA
MRAGTYLPDIAIHPGETLKETIESYGMSQKELADRIDVSEKHISQIINGKASIRLNIANKLEKVFGVSSDFWLNFQRKFDEIEAKLKTEERIKNDLRVISNYNSAYSELVKYDYVPKTRIKIEKVEHLQNFFGLVSLQNMDQIYYNTISGIRCRRSEINPDIYTTLAWLRIGEIQLKEADLPEYNENRLIESIEKFKNMTIRNGNDILKDLRKLCSEAGVLFVYAPYFTKTYLNGVVKWKGKNPIIQMSDRGKYSDIFWFTFFHEIGHVLLHGKKGTYLEYENINNKNKEEYEADQFAQDSLIPRRLYSLFKRSKITRSSIESFAKEIGIDKGIVAGRIANDGLIQYSKISNLRKKML